MQILFLSHYYPPEGNAPATRVSELAQRWAKCGHEVTVVTCAPNVPSGVVYDGYRNRLLPQQSDENGVRVVRVWTYIAANKGSVRRILNYVSFMVSSVLFGIFQTRPSIIIATSPQFFCGWAGVILSALKRRPFILEIRDIWPESIVAVGAGLGEKAIRFLEYLEKVMYRRADQIVTVGRGYRDRLIEKGVPGEAIDVVTNGVDESVYRLCETDPVLIEKHQLEGKFVCSYIGTIGMACGLDVVLRVAKIFMDAGETAFHFLLVGDGAVREELEERCLKENLSNVTFTGRRPKEEMPQYLSISNACLVHLRKTDLFKTVLPSKIFEACAMQRPIVLGVEGDAARLVKEANAGICIEPENELELVEALRRLAADPDLCSEYGKSGHDHVVEHYDRDKLAEYYLKIIESMV